MEQGKERKTLTDIEKEEINLLLEKGVKFSVTYKVWKRKKGIRGWLGQKKQEEVTENFTIEQPTLGTLDRLSEIWVNMEIDEEGLGKGGQETLATAKREAHDNAKLMARVAALAVMGEDYRIIEDRGDGRKEIKYKETEAKRLTELFYETLTPSKLVELANVITSSCNLADFIGSMRLMSGARTTQPKKGRIE